MADIWIGVVRNSAACGDLRYRFSPYEGVKIIACDRHVTIGLLDDNRIAFQCTILNFQFSIHNLAMNLVWFGVPPLGGWNGLHRLKPAEAG